MSSTSIPVVDMDDYRAGGARRDTFVETVGRALADIGFFAVENHDIDAKLTEQAYEAAQQFFHLPEAEKLRYRRDGAKGQRGFTGFGTEHARDQAAPDLKEFVQIGRVDVPDDHPVHAPFGPNLWPDDVAPSFREVMTELYRRLDALGAVLLEACALYVGEAPGTFRAMCTDSDTIVRVIHYPALPDIGEVPEGSVRAAAHEDINLITLLSGATSEGLELLRRDGTWMPVAARHAQIVVDSGDMLQNVTNGLYKSTTHRVVLPEDPSQERFSMPCFVHPRKSVDLTPLASCVERTGGEQEYPSISAGDYLDQRLREIGLG